MANSTLTFPSTAQDAVEFYASMLSGGPVPTEAQLHEAFALYFAAKPTLELADGTICEIGLPDRNCLVETGDGIQLVVSNPRSKDGVGLVEPTHAQNCEVIAGLLANVNEALAANRRAVTIGIDFGALRHSEPWETHLVVYLRPDALVTQALQILNDPMSKQVGLRELDSAQGLPADPSAYSYVALKQQAHENEAKFVDSVLRTTADLQRRLGNQSEAEHGLSLRINLASDRERGNAFLAFVRNRDQFHPPSMTERLPAEILKEAEQIRSHVTLQFSQDVVEVLNYLLDQYGERTDRSVELRVDLENGTPYRMEWLKKSATLRLVDLRDSALALSLSADPQSNSAIDLYCAADLLAHSLTMHGRRLEYQEFCASRAGYPGAMRASLQGFYRWLALNLEEHGSC